MTLRLLWEQCRVDLLILDDWGPEPMTVSQRRDILEIVEERYGRGAILDRLVRDAHKIEP